MNDRNKLKKIADILGDSYIEKPKSIIFTDWKRRFIFNEKHEIIKAQEIIITNGNHRYI